MERLRKDAKLGRVKMHVPVKTDGDLPCPTEAPGRQGHLSGERASRRSKGAAAIGGRGLFDRETGKGD